MIKKGGVLLAGGTGSRLFPKTLIANKHLLPIYDKPMIYYSLSIMFLCDIKDITIVCNDKDVNQLKALLGKGEEFGVKIDYSIQDKPDGIPDAINTAVKDKNYKKFLTVLGDNFLYGREFFNTVKIMLNEESNNSFFYQKVKNPENFGILKWKNEKIIDIVEKPQQFVSNDAVIGLYIFDYLFAEKFRNISKSSRGEFEIVDIIKQYGVDTFNSEYIGRGTAWFDMGSNDDFFNCELFVKTIQDKQGLLVCSPHEIALRNGWVSRDDLFTKLKDYENSEYTINLFKYLEI